MLCPICLHEEKKSWMRSTSKGNQKCPLCGRVWSKDGKKVLYCPSVYERVKKKGNF